MRDIVESGSARRPGRRSPRTTPHSEPRGQGSRISWTQLCAPDSFLERAGFFLRLGMQSSHVERSSCLVWLPQMCRLPEAIYLRVSTPATASMSLQSVVIGPGSGKRLSGAMRACSTLASSAKPWLFGLTRSVTVPTLARTDIEAGALPLPSGQLWGRITSLRLSSWMGMARAVAALRRTISTKS